MKNESDSKGRKGYFHRIIKSLREYHGISQADLCAGLYTNSMMNRIERGERIPSKMNRDIIIGRLGISCERFEEYLPLDEYRQMQMKNQILAYIWGNDIHGADSLLRKMERQTDMRQKATRQFCLTIRADIETLMGGKRQEDIIQLRKKAVSCTMSQYLMEDAWKQERMILSVKEINVLAEYLHAMESDKLIDLQLLKHKYQYLIDKIEQSVFDEIAKAKILPKVIFYFLHFVDGKASLDITTRDFISYSEMAINHLAQQEKSYYLVDLLELLIERLKREIVKNDISSRDLEWYKAVIRERKMQRDVIKDMYEKCGLSPYVKDNGYLYSDTYAVFAGDAIKSRREMLGISREELCFDICDAKSLRRLEAGTSSTNIGVIQELLERLGISSDFCRMEFISERKEVVDLTYGIAEAIARDNWRLAEELLTELEKEKNPSIPDNDQYIDRMSSLCMFRLNGNIRSGDVNDIGKIQKKRISEMNTNTTSELFLSIRELAYVYSIAIEMGDDEAVPYKQILRKAWDWYEKRNLAGTCPAICELISICQIKDLEREGKSTDAVQQYQILLKKELARWRMSILDQNVKKMLWNSQKRRGNDQANNTETERKRERRIEIENNITKPPHSLQHKYLL